MVVGQEFGRATPPDVALLDEGFVDDGFVVAVEPALETLLGAEVVLVALAGGIATVGVIVGLQGRFVTPAAFVVPPVAPPVTLPWFGN